MDNASDMSDTVELLIEQLNSRTENDRKVAEEASLEDAKRNELNVAELQCDSDEKTLRKLVVDMSAIVDDPAKDTMGDAAQVQSYVSQLEESLQVQIKSWNMLKSLQLPTDKLNTLFTVQQEIRKLVTDSTALAEAFITRVNPDVSLGRKFNSTSSTTSNNGEINDIEYNKFFKMEKSQKPTFSGDIRHYARFKSDFLTFVAPSCKDEQHQMYVLKKDCLKGDARKLVENMSDLEAIWERLQDRYGDEVDIVNVIIKGVQDFTFGKSDHDRSLVKFVDELERGIEDLTAIKERSQIANAITVKLVEEKLPRQFLTRWLQQEGASSSNKSRFEEMFTFLKQERKQSERLLLVHEKKSESNQLQRIKMRTVIYPIRPMAQPLHSTEPTVVSSIQSLTITHASAASFLQCLSINVGNLSWTPMGARPVSVPLMVLTRVHLRQPGRSAKYEVISPLSFSASTRLYSVWI